MALMCPSAQPDMEDCRVLGIIGGCAEQPRTTYLTQILPATADVLSLAGQTPAGEVFRLAARCEEGRCAHFNGTHCQLVTRIVEILPAVSDSLPPCTIRNECRWYQQEGRDACFRCPQVMTQVANPAPEVRLAATPV